MAEEREEQVVSRVVFSRDEDLDVIGDPETVVGTLRNGWAQLNRGGDEEPDWVWVNAERVLYVETKATFGSASFQ
jgi:hypothetical protein